MFKNMFKRKKYSIIFEKYFKQDRINPFRESEIPKYMKFGKGIKSLKFVGNMILNLEIYKNE